LQIALLHGLMPHRNVLNTVEPKDFVKNFANCYAFRLANDTYAIDCFRKGIYLYFVAFLSFFSSCVKEFGK
jgi:hypothetical protein